jgi:hypothetical protein
MLLPTVTVVEGLALLRKIVRPSLAEENHVVLNFLVSKTLKGFEDALHTFVD